MPRFLLDSTKRASQRGLLGKLENIAVYLILFFLCFAAVDIGLFGQRTASGKRNPGNIGFFSRRGHRRAVCPVAAEKA